MKGKIKNKFKFYKRNQDKNQTIKKKELNQKPK